MVYLPIPMNVVADLEIDTCDYGILGRKGSERGPKEQFRKMGRGATARAYSDMGLGEIVICSRYHLGAESRFQERGAEYNTSRSG